MTQQRIIARLHDGLGNQLFIYAAARAIADARGAKLLVDGHSGFARDRKYGATAQLQHFAVRGEAAPMRLCYPPPLGRHLRDLQVSLSWNLPLSQRFVVREADFDAVMAGARLRNLVRLEGYWQSERYFASVADKIAEEFRIVSPLSDKSREVAELIGKSESVCLHARQMLGSHHAFNQPPPSHFTQLPFSYYEEAVARLTARVKNPTFFCFADNIEWLRARWSFPFPVHFVDHNRGEQAYEDLALMSRCRHFVVGNSTFSWWGAWLSKNPEKVIIAPDNRGRVRWGSEDALLPSRWDVLKIA
jgi:hypothetical protein